jgi:hypothetical protein
MKVLHLHPYTTVSSFNSQLQQLLGCGAIVYSRVNDELKPFDTLGEAGFNIPGSMEYTIDETGHIRQFEQDFLSRFNISLELCNMERKPLTNKSLRLFQVKNPGDNPVSFSS